MSNDGWDSIASTIGRVLGTAVGAPILGPLAPGLGGLLGREFFGHGHAPEAPAPAPPPGPGGPGGPGGDSPAAPGLTLPPGALPPPPSGPIPGSGAATDKANADAGRVAEVIAQLHELDKSAADTIDAIHAAGEAGQKQLDNIGKDVDDKIAELGPRLNTPAGQQELRDFLKEKLTAAKKVIDQQIADAEEKARHTRELTAKYAGIGGTDAGKAGTEPAGHPDGSGGAGGGGGGGTSGGGSGGGGADQGTTPAAAPGAQPGTPPGTPQMMPGMMPAGMGMPSIPSLGGGIPGLGGGDPLGALGGLGGLGGGHESGFHDDDGGSGGDSSKSGGSGPKFHDDDASSGSGSGSGKPGADTTGTSPASSGGSAGGGPGTELTGNHSDHASDPGAGQGTAMTSLSLPDGSTTDARTAQGVIATKAALGGAPVADAWHQAGVTVPPPGTPVTDPIPPTKLKAGDVGIWQDHLVMALGNGKVLVSGQAQPLSSVGSGPDFLGWMDPSAATPKGVAPAAPPAPPTPPAQPS